MKIRETLMQLKENLSGRNGAHRFWFRFCLVCLALYLAYVTYLSNSNVLLSMGNTLFALALFALIAAGFYGLLLFVCQKMDEHPLRPGKAFAPGVVWLMGLSIAAFVLGSAFLKAYPGGVSYDAANQWWQAHSGEYNNWHPVFHTLLIRLATLAVDRYPFVVFVQAAALGVALTYLTVTLNRHGVPLWAALTAHTLVLLTPLVRNTAMYLWKDNAMTIGAVVLCAQSIRMMATGGAWLKRWQNALFFGLMLAFTTLVRHNALLFTLPLGIIALCSFAGVRRMAALALAVAAAGIVLVRGPLYGSLDVVYPNNTAEEAVGLPMIILGNAMQEAPQSLDEETRGFLLSLADEADWQTVYRRCNYNAIKFTYPRELIADRGAAKILMMAARTVAQEPRLAWEAFNDTTDLVWGIDGHHEGVVEIANSGTIPEESVGQPTLNAIGDKLCALLDAPLHLPPLRWLLCNIGTEQLLLLLAVLIALYRKGPSALMLGFPVLIYNLATMLLLCGNDSRFFQYSMAISLPSMVALLWQNENVTE